MLCGAGYWILLQPRHPDQRWANPLGACPEDGHRREIPDESPQTPHLIQTMEHGG